MDLEINERDKKWLLQFTGGQGSKSDNLMHESKNEDLSTHMNRISQNKIGREKNILERDNDKYVDN